MPLSENGTDEDKNGAARSGGQSGQGLRVAPVGAPARSRPGTSARRTGSPIRGSIDRADRPRGFPCDSPRRPYLHKMSVESTKPATSARSYPPKVAETPTNRLRAAQPGASRAPIGGGRAVDTAELRLGSAPEPIGSEGRWRSRGTGAQAPDRRARLRAARGGRPSSAEVHGSERTTPRGSSKTSGPPRTGSGGSGSAAMRARAETRSSCKPRQRSGR